MRLAISNPQVQRMTVPRGQYKSEQKDRMKYSSRSAVCSPQINRIVLPRGR
jgi:hypothetical protein